MESEGKESRGSEGPVKMGRGGAGWSGLIRLSKASGSVLDGNMNGRTNDQTNSLILAGTFTPR